MRARHATVEETVLAIPPSPCGRPQILPSKQSPPRLIVVCQFCARSPSSLLSPFLLSPDPAIRWTENSEAMAKLAEASDDNEVNDGDGHL